MLALRLSRHRWFLQRSLCYLRYTVHTMCNENLNSTFCCASRDNSKTIENQSKPQWQGVSDQNLGFRTPEINQNQSLKPRPKPLENHPRKPILTIPISCTTVALVVDTASAILCGRSSARFTSVDLGREPRARSASMALFQAQRHTRPHPHSCSMLL